MSSPGNRQHSHNTTTTAVAQDDSALTFVNHQQQQAPGIIPNQSSPTFTVSSSSPSSSFHSPSLFDYHHQLPVYMTSASIKDEQQQQHSAPHHQRMFSYAELLSSQTASPYEHHHFSLHQHHHGGVAEHNHNNHHHHHPPENAGLGIHPHARFMAMGSSNNNSNNNNTSNSESYDNRGHDSNTLPHSSLNSSNALPPPPMTATLHTPYSPSSPIARPFHQQQHQHRHDSDASLYDNNFGYPYVSNGNNNNAVLGGPGGVRERAVSSATTRPITPISPLSDHHHHQSKDYYHRSSYPPPPLGGGDRIVHDYAAADYNSHPSSTATSTKLPPRSRGRRVSNIPTQGVRMFTCQAEGCGKVFKRSEHLKRHIRSIHTMEKPFECPYQSCHKRFSRSDNLNQHIRIHRHSNAGIKTGAAPVPITTTGGGQGGAFPSTNLKDLGASPLTSKMPRVTASYWQ